MTKSKIHKIIVKRNNYDILSAGTDFYAYMDDSRLYYTFDRLIYKEDLSMFYERVENLLEGFFIMRMVAVDGSLLPCYVSVEQGNADDRVLISLINIDKLLESEEKLHNRLVIENKLVELYGDDIFIYEPENDEVKIITKFNIAQETTVMTLDDFGKLLQRHVPTEKVVNVVEFISALRNGSRYFEISVHGSIIDDDPEVKYTVIKGAYVYKDGEKLAATGYIHKGMEMTTGNARAVELDSLTGLLGKGEITDMAIKAIDVERRENICIAILDVDYFKKVNDTFGHLVGDATLRKVASIIETEVGNNGVVGRIGGDEFFILFYNAYDMETSRERLRSIKNIVNANFPPDDEKNPTITLSIGCAAYPKDAENYSDLFALADFALYRAKEKGRNRYIIYDVEKHGTLEEIQKNIKLATRINSRGDMSMGDIMCVIMDKIFSGEEYPVERLLDDYIENFEPQRITIYDASKGVALYMVGEKVPSKDVIDATQRYVLGDFWNRNYNKEVVIVDEISRLSSKNGDVYELMKQQGILSCIHIRFFDKNNNSYILSLESVNKRITWNRDHIHYYKLMARCLAQYSLN